MSLFRSDCSIYIYRNFDIKGARASNKVLTFKNNFDRMPVSDTDSSPLHKLNRVLMKSLQNAYVTCKQDKCQC